MIALIGIAIGYVGTDVVLKARKQGRFRYLTRRLQYVRDMRGMLDPADIAAYHNFLDSIETTGREGVSE